MYKFVALEDFEAIEDEKAEKGVKKVEPVAKKVASSEDDSPKPKTTEKRKRTISKKK